MPTFFASRTQWPCQIVQVLPFQKLVVIPSGPIRVTKTWELKRQAGGIMNHRCVTALCVIFGIVKLAGKPHIQQAAHKLQYLKGDRFRRLPESWVCRF